MAFWTIPERRAQAFEFARFVAAGLVNTGVGYGVYLILLHWLAYGFAYAAAYVAGVVTAYVLNSLFVFRSQVRWRTALRYPLVYLAQYLFGALLLYGMVAWLGLDRRWAALITLAASIPVSFVLNGIVLSSRSEAGS